MTAWTLVTGGARGLGEAICLALARKKHSLVIHYCHSTDDAHRVAAACRQLGAEVETCAGDFSTDESLHAFLSFYQHHFSNTRCVVNNVGNFKLGSASMVPVADYKCLFQLNLFAPLAITQALLPSLRFHRGAIVNIGMAGVERYFADTYCAAYSTAKSALWQATRSLARELAPHNIRVNMVSPGYLESSIVKPSKQETLPFGRAASLAEVADVIGFLLEDANAYITGQNLEVAGGVRL